MDYAEPRDGMTSPQPGISYSGYSSKKHCEIVKDSVLRSAKQNPPNDISMNIKALLITKIPGDPLSNALIKPLAREIKGISSNFRAKTAWRLL
jgi:hypothetical protein